MTTNSRPWQSFTIFISSTFTDMDAERDYLNNIIARDLEREFEKRRVSLTFVDLRWGVHTDKEKRQDERELSVLNVCMEEIKRRNGSFIAFEYKEVIADIGQASFLIDGYANFGWEIDENVMPDMTERYSANKGMHQHKKVVIRMKRALRRSEILRKRRHPVRLYLR